MCGLIGLFTVAKSGLVSSDIKEFKEMMIINSLRGSHSTGVAGVDTMDDNLVNYIKGEGSPYDVFKYKTSDEFFSRAFGSFKLLIGHGRYATQGDVSAKNAHPFTSGHITLAHNGTLSNFLTLQGSDYKDVEVDSELVAKLIEVDGAEKTLPRLHGAYALVWYDSKEKTLNFTRNHARPLWIGLLQNKDTMNWSSERETLEWNRARNRTMYKEIYEFPTMEIHSYSPNSLTPKITKFNTKYTRPINSNNSQWGNRVHPDIWDSDGPNYDTEDGKPPMSNIRFLPNKTLKAKSTTSFTNSKDVATLSRVKYPAKLELGEKIIFVIEDIQDSNGNTPIMINGFNEMFPNVEFIANASAVEENSLYDCDYCRGIINSISAVPAGDDLINYKVVVTNISISQDAVISPDVERVTMMSTAGEEVQLSRFRLKQMADKGCCWCQLTIEATDLLDPDHIMVQDGCNEVVCRSCSNSLLPNLKAELFAKRKIH